MRSVLAACLFAVSVAACSPFSNGDVFNCTTDIDCTLGGAAGTCVDSSVGRVCAYPDGNCSGGAKIGGQAGTVSNECITADGGIGDRPEAGAPVDASVDGPPDAQQCFGATLNICLGRVPTQDVEKTNDIIATGGSIINDACTEKITATGGTDSLCVIEGVNVTLDNVHVTGSRPLVVFALQSITIHNDVTAGWDGGVVTLLQSGPASDRACSGTPGTGPGGGAGGTFGSQGADGGGGGAGTAGALAPVTQIDGGCNGNRGGGARGGLGGGAIYLLTPGAITISGELSSFGEGGVGGQKGATLGGGGGGTGGFIGLEGHTITVTGTVAAGGGAGGGGGGAGAGNGAGRDGTDGRNGAASGGPGGPGTAVGGAGGTADVQGAPTAGAPSATASGPNATSGGGGGGGGNGVIWTTGSVTGGLKIAPTPTAH